MGPGRRPPLDARRRRGRGDHRARVPAAGPGAARRARRRQPGAELRPSCPTCTSTCRARSVSSTSASCKSHLDAALAADDAHTWFSKVIGRSARLVHLDDPTRRHPNPRFARRRRPGLAGRRVPAARHHHRRRSDALNDLIAAGPLADQGPLPTIRFRPNLVVRGARAVGRGRLASRTHRRGRLPQRQGLRPVRDHHDRPGVGRQGQGAHRHVGAPPPLGRRHLVRDEPDPRQPRCRGRPSATRSRCSKPCRRRTAPRADARPNARLPAGNGWVGGPKGT